MKISPFVIEVPFVKVLFNLIKISNFWTTQCNILSACLIWKIKKKKKLHAFKFYSNK